MPKAPPTHPGKFEVKLLGMDYFKVIGGVVVILTSFMIYLYFALEADPYAENQPARGSILKQGIFSIALILGVALLHNNVEKKKYEKKMSSFKSYSEKKAQ